MRVAIAMYEINSPGGIINHTEELAAGLKEIGHEVDLIELVWKDRVRGTMRRDLSGHDVGHLGLKVHQGKGWILPAKNRVPYRGGANVTKAKERLSSYDLIIWTIPVPTCQRSNRGNTDWLPLYEVDVPQIAVIHDGNLPKMYPHLYAALDVQPKLRLACVHPCAYHSAEICEAERAMIFNPQDIEFVPYVSWANRTPGFLSCQTFKAWKHVHELVQAIPYLNRPCVTRKVLAGGGIEHNYMTSKEKCKPQYHHGAGTPWEGKKFWDVAMEHGMEWLGYISNDERDNILSGMRCLVDPSWSNGYAAIGDHFNRVVVDAIRVGTIPIARPLGISTNPEGKGEVFEAGVHYVAIPQDASPTGYAAIIEEACMMNSDQARPIREAGSELLQHFDRKHVAMQFIELSRGTATGWYGTIKKGERTPEVQAKADAKIDGFFKEE